MIVKVYHQHSGRFIAEYDTRRRVLRVPDRGKMTVIDLGRLEAEAQERQKCECLQNTRTVG